MLLRCCSTHLLVLYRACQALDSTYRAAVAALIQRQAQSEDNPAQFITSTFRPELVRVADRCYGISHQNKVRGPRLALMSYVRSLDVCIPSL